MSNLLLDESPLVIQQGLAKKLGLNKAIVVQQLHYLIKRRREEDRDRYFHNNQWWVYNSYQKWRDKFFAFWSARTVRRIFNNLEDDGIFISDNFNLKNYDKTKWYSIDYERLEQILEDKDDEKKEEEDKREGVKPSGQNGHRGAGQSDHTPMDKLTKGYGQSDQSNTKEVTKKSYKDSSSIGEIYEKVFGRTISRHHLEILESFVEDLGKEVVIFGLEYASSQNAKTISYVQRVLNDWVKQKVSSVEEAKQQIKQFQKNRKGSRRDGKAPGANRSSDGEGGQGQSSRLAQKARKLLREGKVSLPEV
ncbi:DnaD domain protein [Natroniella sp. ANB-PHB2]|uniref:DnaD domain-containing protein n=1 Tax=Natroniella sp. ANB-PHB2 TaxID=3384444 RepID=UPI0038D50E22